MSIEDCTPWKPGQSGNPAGKPKGARNRSTIYREHLLKKGKNGQVVDDLVLAAINKALTGDMNALKELMDSGFGKVPDKLLHAETDEEKIERDITDEVLKLLPQEELTRTTNPRHDSRNPREQPKGYTEAGGKDIAAVLLE